MSKCRMKALHHKLFTGLAIGLISVVVLCLLSSPLEAQTFYGAIVGTVSDTSGAVIPGASVTLINIGTNEKRTAETNADGSYRFVNLVPASYRLEVERKGFKRLVREPIVVQVEAVVRIDAALEVGNVTDTIEVTAQTPLLQTESASLSQVVEGQQVQEMPLNGRNIMNLVGLTAGVVPQGSSEGASTMNQGGTHTNNAGWGNFQIGGGIAGLSAWFIDGAPLNVLNGNTVGLVPTQDAIQEFRVASNSVSPEFGRLGGGVVNMTSKSGSNTFHGTAYGYLRDKFLNANDFFNNANNKERGNWDQYQYGATLGGPVVKDKLFFFFSFEGFKSRMNITKTLTVPTLAQRAGTFTTAITDPTGRGCVTHPTSTTWQINPNCFDPTAKVMLDYYYPPAPNATASSYNWFNQPLVGNDAKQYTARMDYSLNDKNRMFGRYTFWNAQDLPQNQMNKIPNAGSQNRSQQVVLGHTYTINPTTLFDLRLSYLRQYYDDKQPTMGMDLGIFGSAWATLQKQVTWSAAPGLSMTSKSGIAGQGGTLINLRYFNIYDVAPSLTWMKRSHSLKFGAEIRLSDANMTGTSQNHSGAFTYDNTLTGDGFAAFLMGLPTQASIGRVSPSSTFNWYKGFYVADTWQATRKLTLNYGVRWELPGTLEERQNRMTVILPDTVDPATNVKGTLALVKSSLYSDRGSIKSRYDLFAPRVGLAYRLDDKTVLRAGYGLNWLPPDLPQDGGGMAFVSVINMASMTYYNKTDSSGAIVGTPRYVSNPFPEGVPDASGRNNPNFMANYLNQNLTGTISDQPYPYLQQWNLSLGRQFAGDLMVEIAYAGAKGLHLPLAGGNNYLNYNFNQLPTKYLYDTTINLKSVGQSLRPYPYFKNIDNRGAWLGRTNYHSMQLKMEKRFHSGGVVMANYTLSKSLGNTDTFLAYLEGGGVGQTQDFTNLNAEYSHSASDTPHRVVVSYVLPLPFGKGQKFANWNGIAGVLASGWSVNGIYQYRAGFPIPFSANKNYLANNLGFGTIRPNMVQGCDPNLGSARSITKWFNTACLKTPGDLLIGDAPRMYGGVRADGVNNSDLSLGKATTIWKEAKLDFRAEAFNLFNRTQFALPGVNVDVSSTFGVVTAMKNYPRMIQLSLRLTF